MAPQVHHVLCPNADKDLELVSGPLYEALLRQTAIVLFQIICFH
jgi:hypothetical protein